VITTVIHIFVIAYPSVGQGLALDYCFHQLTGQRFSGEHVGSFLAGTRRLEKKRRIIVTRIAAVESIWGSP
jgi:hypothetical protein